MAFLLVAFFVASPRPTVIVAFVPAPPQTALVTDHDSSLWWIGDMFPLFGQRHLGEVTWFWLTLVVLVMALVRTVLGVVPAGR
jgi:hypothetical protein